MDPLSRSTEEDISHGPEMRCFRKILRILYKDYVTNEEVRNKIQSAIEPYKDPMTTIEKRKLKRYGHVPRS